MFDFILEHSPAPMNDMPGESSWLSRALRVQGHDSEPQNGVQSTAPVVSDHELHSLITNYRRLTRGQHGNRVAVSAHA